MTLTKGTEYPRFSWRFVGPDFRRWFIMTLAMFCKNLFQGLCRFACILNKSNRCFRIYTLYLLISVYISLSLVIKKTNIWYFFKTSEWAERAKIEQFCSCIFTSYTLEDIFLTYACVLLVHFFVTIFLISWHYFNYQWAETQHFL